MAQDVHPAAPQHLPAFLPGPDGSDPLFSFTIVMVIGMAMLLGVVYLSLHSAPERMAHRANNTQLQAVAVLTMLALFTHNHLFWIIALLIAVVRLPDFATPLNTIARALAKREGVTHVEPDDAASKTGARDHA